MHMHKNLNYFFNQLKHHSSYFKRERKINDIYTNSKIYEVVISEQLQHTIINGHANSPDAKDSFGNIFEYKHYKASSSNHTWTFNDFSDATIQKLSTIDYVVFTEIDDSAVIPCISKMYIIPAEKVSNYLYKKVPKIKNKRSMINISAHQIEHEMKYHLANIPSTQFSNELIEVFETAYSIEKLTNISNILTSNKLWELLVAMELGHNINPEQYKHDAVDKYGQTYEYKVYANMNWSFQDISDSVLNGYLYDKAIILAVVDKSNLIVKNIFSCDPKVVVDILSAKLQKKIDSGTIIRRLKETITKSDLRRMLNNNVAHQLL